MHRPQGDNTMELRELPRTDIDLFSDDVIRDPYPAYRDLRDAGPVVWSNRLDVALLPRYSEVREVLGDHGRYVSSKGVGFNEILNQAFIGTIIQSDLPDHTALRSALGERLSPVTLRSRQADVQQVADELVQRLRGREIDGVADLARVLPLTIVADMVGIPQEGRDKLLAWGDANFNVMGPRNERFDRSLPVFQECFGYIQWLHEDPENRLRRDGLGYALYEAADRGVIRRDQCPALMAAYLVAGVDTTIASIGFALKWLGLHPDQFALLRAEPALATRAYNEVLRIESPAQGFVRVASSDTELAGVKIPGGTALAVLYASANRDERKFPDPERFDIRRQAGDHLAFGFGLHVCAGQALARLEATAVLTALARQVERIEIGAAVPHLNNTVRGLERLQLVLH
jgi:cytochrome P450